MALALALRFTDTPWEKKTANYLHTYTLQLSENILTPVKGRKKNRQSDGPQLNTANIFSSFSVPLRGHYFLETDNIC